MRKVRVGGDIRRRRAAEYPPVGDQLDALMKLARAIMDAGISLPVDTVALVEQCEAVKASLPKPPAEFS